MRRLDADRRAWHLAAGGAGARRGGRRRSSSAPRGARRRAAGSPRRPRSCGARSRCHPTRAPGRRARWRPRSASRDAGALDAALEPARRGRGRGARRARARPRRACCADRSRSTRAAAATRRRCCCRRGQTARAGRRRAWRARRYLEALGAPRCSPGDRDGAGGMLRHRRGRAARAAAARPARGRATCCSTAFALLVTEGHRPRLRRCGGRASCVLAPRPRPTIDEALAVVRRRRQRGHGAQELWDADAWRARLPLATSSSRVTPARSCSCQFALNMLAWVHVVAAATSAQAPRWSLEEERMIAEATGNPPSPVRRACSLAAWRGDEAEAAELIEATVERGDGPRPGRVGRLRGLGGRGPPQRPRTLRRGPGRGPSGRSSRDHLGFGAVRRARAGRGGRPDR